MKNYIWKILIYIITKKKKTKNKRIKKCKTKKEKGCVEPNYGIKSNWILNIDPQNKNIEKLKIWCLEIVLKLQIWNKFFYL